MATESDKKDHEQVIQTVDIVKVIYTVDTCGVEFSAVKHRMEVHEILRRVSHYVCSEEALLERLRLTHENYVTKISGKKKKQGTFKNRDICSKSLDLQVMVHTIDMFGIEESAISHNVEPEFLFKIISRYRASQGARLQRLRLAQETYYKGKEAQKHEGKATCIQQIEKEVEVHTSDEESNVNRKSDPLQKQVMKNHKKTAYLFMVFVSGFIAYLFMRKTQ